MKDVKLVTSEVQVLIEYHRNSANLCYGWGELDQSDWHRTRVEELTQVLQLNINIERKQT